MIGFSLAGLIEYCPEPLRVNSKREKKKESYGHYGPADCARVADYTARLPDGVSSSHPPSSNTEKLPQSYYPNNRAHKCSLRVDNFPPSWWWEDIGFVAARLDASERPQERKSRVWMLFKRRWYLSSSSRIKKEKKRRCLLSVITLLAPAMS